MIHIWTKRTCPVCLQPFYPGDCAIVSDSTPGEVLKAAPTYWWHKALARMLPLPVEGSIIQEGAYRQCPNAACNYLLPRYIEIADNVNIVVAGPTFSGKTHYIAAMIYEILQGRIQRANQFFRVNCLTQDIEYLYRRDVLDPLFQRKQVLPPTPPALEQDVNRYPLIYELVVWPLPEHPYRRINLLFYDAAGEDLADEKRLIRFSRYVFNASGIIFLVDPVSIPAFAQTLPSHLQSKIASGQASSSVFTSIIKLLENYRKRDAGADFASIPMAIMLAKSDLISQVETAQQKYTFWQKTSNDGTIDWTDLDKVNQEMQQFLVDYGEESAFAGDPCFLKEALFRNIGNGQRSE